MPPGTARTMVTQTNSENHLFFGTDCPTLFGPQRLKRVGLPKEQPKGQPLGWPFGYFLEDWMKRSFVSCNYYNTGELLTKTAPIVTKVLNHQKNLFSQNPTENHIQQVRPKAPAEHICVKQGRHNPLLPASLKTAGIFTISSISIKERPAHSGPALSRS